MRLSKAQVTLLALLSVALAAFYAQLWWLQAIAVARSSEMTFQTMMIEYVRLFVALMGAVSVGLLLKVWFQQRNTLKQDTHKLKESKTHYQTLFQNAADAVMLQDFDGRILDANQRATEVLGYSREELLKLNFRSLLGADGMSRLSDFYQRLERSKSTTMEAAHRRKDGEWLTLEINAALVVTGEAQWIHVSLRDITEKQRHQLIDQAHAHRMEAVNEILATLNSSRETADILKRILDTLRRAFPAHVSALIAPCTATAPRFNIPYVAVAAHYPHVLKPGTALDPQQVRPLIEAALSRNEVVVFNEGGELWTPPIVAFFESLGLRAALASVLRVREGEPLLLLVGMMRATRWTEEERATLSDVARYLAIGLDNAQLFEAEKKRTRQLGTLNELVNTISQSLDLDGILNRLLTRVQELTHGDVGQIYLINEQKNELQLRAAIGQSAELQRVVGNPKLAEGVIGRIVQTGRFELVQPPATSLTTNGRGAGSASPFNCLAYFPLRAKERVMGVMILGFAADRQFSADDLRLLGAISDAAAVAIDNAQLFLRATESEERFYDLFENAADTIFVCEGADARITVLNATFERSTGLQRGEWMGRPLTELLVAEDVPVFKENYQDTLKGWNTSFNARCNAKDGSVRTFAFQNRPFAVHGKIVGAHGIARDITETKSLERQLQQAQKMEAIGTLSGGVAHDFNNVLTSIIGYAELLQRRMGSADPNVRDIEQIEQAAQRAARLVKQLLAFSRKTPQQLRPLNLNTLMGETVHMLSRSLREDVVMRTELDEHIRLIVGDDAQLQQAVINLCVNAADAMPHGGALVLSTYDLVVTDDFRRAHPEASAPRYAVVSVADTGTGIAPDVLPHIFEPFFTTKGVGLGTGLGLAMVYGTVKSHGGWIDVQSELGKGSTFSLYLPSSDVPLGAEKETAPTVEYGTGCILLVDDEEAVLKLGKEILETYGYEVLTAPSGERALEIYREQGDEIDLVVIDMVMPHMNAPELFEHLQKMNPNVQAILCSGYAPDSRVDDLLRRGVREFIPKPYDIAHFVNTANRILKEKNAPRPALRATGRPAPKHR